MRKMPEKEKAELLSALEKARKRSRSHSSQQSTSTQVGNSSTLLKWIDPVNYDIEFDSNSPQNDASPSPSPPVIAATAQIHRSSSPGSSAKSQVIHYKLMKLRLVLLQFITKATEYYLDHSSEQYLDMYVQGVRCYKVQCLLSPYHSELRCRGNVKILHSSLNPNIKVLPRRR